MYIWNIIKSELNSEVVGDHKESEYDEKREKVYLFYRLPIAFEKVSVLLLFTYFISTNSIT